MFYSMEDRSQLRPLSLPFFSEMLTGLGFEEDTILMLCLAYELAAEKQMHLESSSKLGL